jgi:hypothetical protein
MSRLLLAKKGFCIFMNFPLPLHRWRSNVAFLLLLIALMGLLSASSVANATTSREEETVRTAYAKLAYANEIAVLRTVVNATPVHKYRTAEESAADKALLENELSFQIDEVTTGPLAEIAQKKWTELQTVPYTGDVLHVIPATWNYTFNDNNSSKTEWTLYAIVDWVPTEVTLTSTDTWTVQEVLDLPESRGPFSRYAFYSVKVAYKGKSRSYRALAFFGKNSDGTDHVLFWDLVADGSTLALLAKTEVYPAPFTDTPLRTIPFVRKWLADNQKSCGANHKIKTGVCCDSGKCGVGTEDLQRSHLLPISRIYPIQPSFREASFRLQPRLMFQASGSSDICDATYSAKSNKEKNSLDANQHTSGFHTFNSVVNGACQYSKGGAAICNRL